MLEVLRHRTFARLFAAQTVALLGTGLLTVALGLLAFDLAGTSAGVVLGTALTIKMLAYVGLAPVVAALAHTAPRKVLLVGADLIRAAIALSLPLVSEVWQIYILIFALQAASATFTPAFQALIPEVLPVEAQYTRALSLSRLAYDLEALLSPVVAAVLLTRLGYQNLFVGTFLGFLASAAFVLLARLPERHSGVPQPFLQRLTAGVRVFARHPPLRSLAGMDLAVASATAMVLVNTVVLVRVELDRPESDVAVLLAAFGGGSMAVALCLPRLLERLPDRSVMLAGTVLVPAGLGGVAALTHVAPEQWAGLLALWTLLGAAISLVLTPSARLLRRASTPDTRAAVFATQFAASHACFIVTYPLAGALGASAGLPTTALVLAVLAMVASLVACLAWSPGWNRPE